jgi:hypothetical protein
LKNRIKENWWIILILSFLLSVMAFNTYDSIINMTSKKFHQLTTEQIKNGLKTIEVDGCEYLVSFEETTKGVYGSLAHKGNCKNPIHIYNKEVKK